MSSVVQSIREVVTSRPEGTVFLTGEFLRFGTRAAVDQALSRLVKAGTLTRVSRGAFTANLQTRFGNVPPPAEAVVKSWSTVTGEQVCSNEAVAANRLGVTTQIPVRHVFLTSGRERRLQLGKTSIHVRHVPKWLTVLPGRTAGEVVRALSFVGKREAAQAVRVMKPRVPAQEWRELEAVKGRLPVWMTAALVEGGAIG